MKKRLILACIDFSPVTRRVLDIAAELARLSQADLVVAHVVLTPLPANFGPVQSPVTQGAMGQAHHSARERLDLERERIHQQFGVKPTALLMEATQCSVPLMQEAERLRPSIIVVGSHGYGALGRFLMGSTSQGVLRGAKCPVLVVPSAMADEAASGDADGPQSLFPTPAPKP